MNPYLVECDRARPFSAFSGISPTLVPGSVIPWEARRLFLLCDAGISYSTTSVMAKALIVISPIPLSVLTSFSSLEQELESARLGQCYRKLTRRQTYRRQA